MHGAHEYVSFHVVLETCVLFRLREYRLRVAAVYRAFLKQADLPRCRDTFRSKEKKLLLQDTVRKPRMAWSKAVVISRGLE